MSRAQILDTTWHEFLAIAEALQAEEADHDPNEAKRRRTPEPPPDLTRHEQQMVAERGAIVREE